MSNIYKHPSNNISYFSSLTSCFNYDPHPSYPPSLSTIPSHITSSETYDASFNGSINNINAQTYSLPPLPITSTSKNAIYKTGNFNFYDELNKDDDIEDENNDKCLISNLLLDKTKIELECGHKFNYFYIFNETVNSKKINNNIYGQDKLGNNSIRCPYCRTVYKSLLPPSLDIDGTQELSCINFPYKFCMPIKCGHHSSCNKKTYVTPLGSFCKRHYYYIKSNGTIDQEFEENENNCKVKIYNENEIHKDWEKYRKYKVCELKTILKNNGLKISGTKPILITRLLNNNIPLSVDCVNNEKFHWNISQ